MRRGSLSVSFRRISRTVLSVSTMTFTIRTHVFWAFRGWRMQYFGLLISVGADAAGLPLSLAWSTTSTYCIHTLITKNNIYIIHARWETRIIAVDSVQKIEYRRSIPGKNISLDPSAGRPMKPYAQRNNRNFKRHHVKCHKGTLFFSRRIAIRIHEISDLKKAPMLSLGAEYTRLKDQKKHTEDERNAKR